VSDSAVERPLLSLVIPVYNERESLEPLYKEITEVAAALAYETEILFVDDGSDDGSWQTICALHSADERVSAVRFRRNFGKAAALAAGFALARGQRVLTLDADLQDDPHEIPRFLSAIDEGYDVVSGWKRVRRDPWHKRLPSRVFNGTVSALTGVYLHDHNCGFKCYREEVLDEIQLYGEFHRFTPVLADAKGFRVGEIVVNHRPRQFGRSKYGWERFLRGFLDLLTVKFLTAYRNRPQHLLGSLGLVCFAAGTLGLVYLSVVWLLTRIGSNFGWEVWVFSPIGQRPLLMFSAIGVLLGAQMISIGLIAELITARNQHEAHVYSVAEKRLSRRRTQPADSAPAADSIHAETRADESHE
jgi:dolichol-phosphate mannosyltransferase